MYKWQDVPVGQQVGIARAQFDQGGYQLVTDTGDTIVVPFVNQNLYVMRFGRSNGQTYFVNENGAPTLYCRRAMAWRTPPRRARCGIRFPPTSIISGPCMSESRPRGAITWVWAGIPA